MYKWNLAFINAKFISFFYLTINYSYIIIPLILIIIYPIIGPKIFKWIYVCTHSFIKDKRPKKINYSIYAGYNTYIKCSLFLCVSGYIREIADFDYIVNIIGLWNHILNLIAHLNFPHTGPLIITVIIIIISFFKNKIKDIMTDYKKRRSLFVTSRMYLALFCTKYVFIVNLLVSTNILDGNCHVNLLDLSLFCILFDNIDLSLKNWRVPWTISHFQPMGGEFSPIQKNQIFNSIARNSDMSFDYILNNFPWSTSNLWAVSDFLNIFKNDKYYVVAHNSETGKSLAMPLNNSKYFMPSDSNYNYINVFEHTGQVKRRNTLRLTLKDSNTNSVLLYSNTRHVFKYVGNKAIISINNIVHIENLTTGEISIYDPWVKGHGKKWFMLKDMHGDLHRLSIQSLSPTSGSRGSRTYLGLNKDLTLIKNQIGKEPVFKTVAENGKGLSEFKTVFMPTIANRPRISRFQ